MCYICLLCNTMLYRDRLHRKCYPKIRSISDLEACMKVAQIWYEKTRFSLICGVHIAIRSNRSESHVSKSHQILAARACSVNGAFSSAESYTSPYLTFSNGALKISLSLHLCLHWYKHLIMWLNLQFVSGILSTPAVKAKRNIYIPPAHYSWTDLQSQMKPDCAAR